MTKLSEEAAAVLEKIIELVDDNNREYNTEWVDALDMIELYQTTYEHVKSNRTFDSSSRMSPLDEFYSYNDLSDVEQDAINEILTVKIGDSK